MWDKEVISKVSKHYKTGEKLPEENLIQMEKVRRANQAMTTLQQVFLGTFDFMFHSANDASLKNSTALSQVPKGGISYATIRDSIKKDGFLVDSKDLWRNLKKDITGIPEQEGSNPIASFGHIVGGYASAYYGYLWSLVYASEVFSQFQEKGLLNPEVGMKYRKVILAPGGSKDSMDSLKEFLGREPN